MLRRHGPILTTAAAAVAAYLLLALSTLSELSGTRLSSAGLAIFFVLGLLYTQLFEYAAHRFAMHRGIRWLSDVRRNHLEHHQVFHGARFRTNRPEDLEHIPGRWWIFPLLLGSHFFAFRTVLAADAVMAFLLGSVVHYLIFEVTHWLTHVDDNAVDRAIEKIPGLSELRRYQIEHHRIHHEMPIVAFNFNPPYLGDRLTGLMPARHPLPLDVLPAPSPTAPSAASATPTPTPAWTLPSPSSTRPLFTRPFIRYGAVVLIGAAALGLGVAAHGWWAKDRVRPPSKAQTKLAKA